MNDAGSKALRNEKGSRYSNNNSSMKQAIYDDARKHANTAPSNNSKPEMKVGGQFQSNAMMMMAPFPVSAGNHPMGMMPMYQPISVHTSNGIQMMQPGYYPQMGVNIHQMPMHMVGIPSYPQHPNQNAGHSGQYAYMPGQHVVGSKSASNYYSHNNLQDHTDASLRHGATEQGNFHVA